MNNDSDTSADLQFNILDNLGDKIKIDNNQDTSVKKPESSDTDYYLNLLANQNKLNDESRNNSEETSSLSEIINSDKEDKDDDKRSSSSIFRFK